VPNGPSSKGYLGKREVLLTMDQAIELQDYLRVISKYKWLIMFCTMLCVATALFVTANMTPIYESSIQLLVNQSQSYAAGYPSAADAYQSILMSERLAKTYSQMIQSRSTANKIIEKTGVSLTPAELINKINAEPIRDTQLIKVTVEDENPARARLIANATGEVFKKTVEDIELNGLSKKSRPLISITVVEPAITPSAPIKPKPVLNLVLALFIGLASSTGLAFLLNYLDTTIKDTDEAERISGLISLGQIPVIPKGKELIVKAGPRSTAAEAFRMLKTNLQYINFDSTIRTVVVTSAGAGEGKTLFSANLAAVIALSGHRVLAVSCDLRKPRLHQVFGLSNDVGLANILIGAVSLDAAIQETEIERLDLIASGPAAPNPADLLESARMQLFLEEAQRRYDFIILDTPPAILVTDALVLVSRSDGVILLARSAVTTKHAFLALRGALKKVNARVLGFSLNAVSSKHRYGYYKYYRYYGQGQKSYLESASAKAKGERISA